MVRGSFGIMIQSFKSKKSFDCRIYVNVIHFYEEHARSLYIS